jgi:hypothetical protein
MYSKLFRELLNNKVVFVPSEFITYFLSYCAVYMNCHPCGGAIEPDGQYFYIG